VDTRQRFREATSAQPAGQVRHGRQRIRMFVAEHPADHLEKPGPELLCLRILTQGVMHQAEIDQLSRAWGDTDASRMAAEDALTALSNASHSQPHSVTAEGSIK